MNKDSVLALLRKHAPELKAAGVLHLHLFGSVARGEATVHSDVDLLADFDPSCRLSLIALSSLNARLNELLGADVEITSVDWMRDQVRTRALEEAVLAF